MVKTPEQISQASQAALQTALQLAQLSMENAERLVQLQLDAAKGMLEANLKNARALAGAKDPQQYAALCAQSLENEVEQMSAYSRGVYELAARTQSEFGKVMESRVAAFGRELSQLAAASGAAPGGSAPAIAAMQQALAATNTMIETMSAAARQFGAVADSNIKSATAAAAQAARGGARKRS